MFNPFQECRLARVRKDREDVKLLTLTLTDTMNPFSPELDPDHLYCLTNGVEFKPDIAVQLINLRSLGQQWMAMFIDECKENRARFEETIKRQKVGFIIILK